MICSAVICFGQTNDASKKLAKESKFYCISTSVVKPTAPVIIEKVNEACAVINKEGEKSFSKFKGWNSKFIFSGTYLWINDMNGKVLMHPLSPVMENHSLIGLKDLNGKHFFSEMISLAKERENGWVAYYWKNTSSEKKSLKLSYVKKCLCNGVPVVVGCSVDDVALAK
jgi:signal transduction histidine kinase